jgi:diguanylate cyclase (GGDEF)-like protein
VAETVQRLLRATDFLARYGGEEFLLILSPTRAADASRVCERVRRAIAELHSPSLPAEHRISVSIGTTEHHAADSMAMTLHRADQAMYEAKRRGRNCVVSAD